MIQMAKRRICVLLSTFLHFVTAHTFCAEFEFDNAIIQNNTLSAKINTEVNITFKLKNKSCSNLVNAVIQISVWDSNKNVPYPQCQIVRKDGSCRDPADRPTRIKCDCLKDGAFIFTAIVSESDSTTWIWSTSQKEAETVILFNITTQLVASEPTTHFDESMVINVIATNSTWTQEHSIQTILGINRDVFIHVAVGVGTGSIVVTFCCFIIHRAMRRRREERWDTDHSWKSPTSVFYVRSRASPAVQTDTTTWIWSTSEKQAETVILFNITNADIIHPMTELTMLNTLVSISSSTELVTSETTKHTDVSTDINVIATNSTWTQEHSDHTVLGINREVFIHIAAGAGTGATTICIAVCCLIIHRARKRRREERWELDDISLPDLRWTPPRAKPAVRRGYLKNDFTEINNERTYDWAH